LGLADQWQLRWFLRDSRRGDELAVRAAARRGGGRTGDAIPDVKTGDGIAGFMQEVVRVRGEDGAEAVYGVLRAEFVPGQRNAVVHVGFCPALERAPVVTVERVERERGRESFATGTSPGLGNRQSQKIPDPGAEVRVVQAFCHGARLEVRLARAAEDDCAVMVEVMARSNTENEEVARG
jgi:hypothetical protein